MTADKLRYAQYLMADSIRSIPEICKELLEISPPTLYYLHADGSLKSAGRDPLVIAGKEVELDGLAVIRRSARSQSGGFVRLFWLAASKVLQRDHTCISAA